MTVTNYNTSIVEQCVAAISILTFRQPRIPSGQVLMMNIAILDDYQHHALSLADWNRLPTDCRITVFDDHLPPGEALIRRLVPFDIICVMRERTPMPRELLTRLPNLRLVVTTGARNDAIDLTAAAEGNITVCGTESPGHATAELAFGLILALARGLYPQAESMRAGGWQIGLGRDLRGMTLGVIGLGRLGSQVAGFGKAFGMKVIAWSHNLTDERASECGVSRVDKTTLLRQADFITVHLKLGDRSRHLIDAEALALMKSDACLVNTSRAPIVDTAALIAALEQGRLGGAALDVYDQEPLPVDHPLRSTPRLLLTPHIGYVTEQTYRVFYQQTVEAILAYLDGNPTRQLTVG